MHWWLISTFSLKKHKLNEWRKELNRNVTPINYIYDKVEVEVKFINWELVVKIVINKSIKKSLRLQIVNSAFNVHGILNVVCNTTIKKKKTSFRESYFFYLSKIYISLNQTNVL